MEFYGKIIAVTVQDLTRSDDGEAVMTQEAVLAMLALFAYLAFLFLIVGAGVILLFLRRRALRPLPSPVVIPREERRYLPLSLGAAAYLLILIYLFVNSYL